MSYTPFNFYNVWWFSWFFTNVDQILNLCQKYLTLICNISQHNSPYTSKEKFLSNSNNKTELISKLVEALEAANVTTVCCRDDADTIIIRECLHHSLLDTVEVRVEDADILIMLVHHYDQEKHHNIIVTTSAGSYCIKEIVQSLTYEQKKYLLFCHSFTGCDTVSSFRGFSKEKLYARLCSGNLSPLIDVFYDANSSKDNISEAGVEIIQFIYKSWGTQLSSLRVNKYNKQSRIGVIKPENLPQLMLLQDNILFERISNFKTG